MLVLTRYIGETLIIGDDIQVKVFGVKRKQVKIGTHAPQQVSVHREEIHHKIKQESVVPEINYRHKVLEENPV